MIRIKKNNPFAAITILVLIAILFIGMWVMMKPFAEIYNKFMDDSTYSARYPAEADCKGHGYWFDGSCHQLPERGKSSMQLARYTWLWVPFMLVVGLFIWLIIVASKKDPVYFQR